MMALVLKIFHYLILVGIRIPGVKDLGRSTIDFPSS